MVFHFDRQTGPDHLDPGDTHGRDRECPRRDRHLKRNVAAARAKYGSITKFVDGVAKDALGEGEDLAGPDGIDLNREPVGMGQGAILRRILPAAVPLQPEGIADLLKHRLISRQPGVTLKNDVNAVIPVAATGRENDVRVGAQVDCLLLIGPGREMQFFTHPHRHEWRDVGSSVGAHRGEPEQLGDLDLVLRRRPTERRGLRVAESPVE